MLGEARIVDVATATTVGTLLAMALGSSGCDTRCVGPDCPGVTQETGLFPDDTDPTDGQDDGPSDDERDQALPLVRSCDVVRLHKPERVVGSVAIAGSFNDWTPVELEGPDADGWWTADMGPLTPGLYPYKYLYNGQWESSIPTSAELQWDGGIENRSLRVGDCTKPDLQVVQATATADGTVIATIRYALGSDGAALDESATWARIGDQAVTPNYDRDSHTITLTADGLPQGKHTVRLTVTDTAGRRSEREVFTPLWVEPERFEWTDGPMYLVFVDRFRNGDLGPSNAVGATGPRSDYNGGDLLGVQQAIEDGWFDELGIRSIWLSPLYDNPDQPFQGLVDSNTYAGYHGYWPIKGRAVEPKLGDDEMSAEERLKALVATAHEHGIRIVFDGVYNHVHEQHEYRTQHPEWFGSGCVCGTDGCSWDDKPIECWFTSYMPDLDHTNPWITEQMVQDTMWWMREFDLDGIRIDAVKHMHRAMTVNLRHRLRDEIEQGGGAHVYTVGETFTGGDGHDQLVGRIGPFEMDAQFDFPIYWTIRDVFARGASMRNLEDKVRRGVDTWGDAPMSPFAGNHDIGRLATDIAGNDQGPWGNTPDLMASGGDQSNLAGGITSALAFALTQPGVPLLYYGDEIGLAGSGDPDNRRLMSFPPYLSANQQSLLARVRAIGQARAASRALQRGTWTPLWAAQDVLVYARHTDDDVAIVVITRGGPHGVDVPVQGLVADGTTLTDRLGNQAPVTIADGKLRVEAAGHVQAIFTP